MKTNDERVVAEVRKQKATVRSWMRANFVEGFSATKLAEAAVSELSLPDSYLDDETHWIWEIALDVEEEFENC